MLKMLESDTDGLKNVHFALITALGTILKQDAADSGAIEGIKLRQEDESVVLQPGLRGNMAVANALSDLRLFSEALVDWLEGEPSLIAEGREPSLIARGWPIRHVRFLCENVATMNDSKRALRFVDSLLRRLHSSAFQMADRELLLWGLRAVHALVPADGGRKVLPFLRSGDAEQRARVLEAAVELKIQFGGQETSSSLAHCLLLEKDLQEMDDPFPTHIQTHTYRHTLLYEPTLDHERSKTLLSYVLKREAEKYRYSSLRESSDVFVFLVNIVGQSTADSQQTCWLVWLRRYLMGIDSAHLGKAARGETGEQRGDGETPEGVSMQAALVESESLQESDEHRLLTTNASSIDRHLREFLPGILDRQNSPCLNSVGRYCAASLWTSSDLVQETEAKDIARWLVLREDERACVVKAFGDLKHLQEPWMQGREGTDGKWERQVLEALQLGTLGRFIFAMLLSYIREKVIREPSSALEGCRLLSETIQDWDAETDEKRLEQRLLLKELCIGRRNEHLPSWSGGVTKMTSLPQEWSFGDLWISWCSFKDDTKNELAEGRQRFRGETVVIAKGCAVTKTNDEQNSQFRYDTRVSKAHMQFKFNAVEQKYQLHNQKPTLGTWKRISGVIPLYEGMIFKVGTDMICEGKEQTKVKGFDFNFFWASCFKVISISSDR
jgi:hypothetical protein